MKSELKNIFETAFEAKSHLQYFFSPGRVNLIGEHTDYNGGHVFPMTISLGTYGVASRRVDKKIRCFSANFPELGYVELELQELDYKHSHEWVNYVKGVMIQFEKRGYTFETGFDLAIKGTIPGGGLSSSASLELLICVMFEDLYNFNIDRLEMVKLSRAVENDYIGVNCGIMDQFIIGMGKKDHAILLDTNTLKYKHVKLQLNGYTILIGNTNKKRTLADSKYNERYRECQMALKIMQKKYNIKSLGELTIEMFEASKSLIKDGVILRRAQHAVYENQRTLASYNALKAGDIKAFAHYMNVSHESLKDDYEVSCIELDTMVYSMRKQRGVIGCRMTGAGFGGCTVSLVSKENIEEVIRNVSKDYLDQIGYACDFHLVESVNGAGKL